MIVLVLKSENDSDSAFHMIVLQNEIFIINNIMYHTMIIHVLNCKYFARPLKKMERGNFTLNYFFYVKFLLIHDTVYTFYRASIVRFKFFLGSALSTSLSTLVIN